MPVGAGFEAVRGVAIRKEAQASLDSSVGFSNAPEAAQLHKANKHLGVKTVVGGWAYRGSRAAYSKGRMLNAQGRYLNSVNTSGGLLICLKTGSRDADGWYAWGGNGEHNKNK